MGTSYLRTGSFYRFPGNAVLIVLVAGFCGPPEVPTAPNVFFIKRSLRTERIRRQEIQVFFTAFIFFIFETSIFNILQFTHNHLEATLVISYALLGLAIGSLVTYFLRKSDSINFPLLVIFFMLSIILAFINITRFPGFVHLSPFMVFPFMMGNIIITFFFRTENTNRIYFFDLAGATCGIFFSVVTIPLLKTENALLICIALMSCVGFLLSKKKNRVMRAVLCTFFVISLTAMVANLQWHVLELEKIA